MSTTLAEIWADYAEAMGKSVKQLTEKEKQQAFYDAVAADKRVEPFATFSDLIDYAAERDRIVADALEWLLDE